LNFRLRFYYIVVLNLIKIGDKFGYVNSKGEWAIKPQFSFALPFTEELAADVVGKGSKRKAGYINPKGEWIITGEFDERRRFCSGLAPVRSRDKKFAYDICHGRMIEYLLANTDLTLEMERDMLAISFMSRLDPEKIEFNLERMIAVRMLMPEYLLDRS
jgi:hypothetical protein